MNYTADQMRDFRERMNREYRFNMSEFVEIDGMLVRISYIVSAQPNPGGGTYVQFRGDTNEKFDEPYESVRRKLLGGPSQDLRGEFVDQVTKILGDHGHHEARGMVRGLYLQLMHSETEGAE